MCGPDARRLQGVLESVLLVHSPLVGPSVWTPFAGLIVGRGADVCLPDLTRVTDFDPPWHLVFVDTVMLAAIGLEPPVTVIGHSGAGAFLPAIGERLGDRLDALVFVDAVVPAESGVHQSTPNMDALLDEHTVDGLLLRWLDWWPSETIELLIPTPGDRVELQEDMPRLPRRFYDEEVPLPEGWSDWPCCFIDLSGAYRSEVEEARRRGWPRTSIDGTHLSLYTEPETVLNAVESAVSQTRT